MLDSTSTHLPILLMTVHVRIDGGGLGRWDGERVEKLSAAEGLPSGTVECLLRGREGQIWVGTGFGLARVTDAPVSQYGSRRGLTGRAVISVAAGRGGLWVVTEEGGLQLFDGDRYSRVPLGEIDGAPGDLRRVAEGKDGTVYLGTRHGLYRLKEGRVDRVESPADAERARCAGAWRCSR